MAIPACRRFDRQRTVFAFVLARLSAGRSRPARMAMMAITTRSSMSVKARFDALRIRFVVRKTRLGQKSLGANVVALMEWRATKLGRREVFIGVALSFNPDR